jgi:hypothetical protein
MTALHTKSFMRRLVEQSFDGMRRAVSRTPAP